jgi:hypothetical protein
MTKEDVKREIKDGFDLVFNTYQSKEVLLSPKNEVGELISNGEILRMWVGPCTGILYLHKCFPIQNFFRKFHNIEEFVVYDILVEVYSEVSAGSVKIDLEQVYF